VSLPLNVGGHPYNGRRRKEIKMWDNLTEKCEKCGVVGMTAPNLWGKLEFFHQVPSPRLEGYFTFDEKCPEKK
jgi:hypothetical protein